MFKIRPSSASNFLSFFSFFDGLLTEKTFVHKSSSNILYDIVIVHLYSTSGTLLDEPKLCTIMP